MGLFARFRESARSSSPRPLYAIYTLVATSLVVESCRGNSGSSAGRGDASETGGDGRSLGGHGRTAPPAVNGGQDGSAPQPLTDAGMGGTTGDAGHFAAGGMSGSAGLSATGGNGGLGGAGGQAGAGIGNLGGTAGGAGTAGAAGRIGGAPGFDCYTIGQCKLGEACVGYSATTYLCVPDPDRDPDGYAAATAQCTALGLYGVCDGPEDRRAVA